MEHFIEIVKEWGYLAVLLGSMIEGESVILTACVMAYMGYLSIAKIVAIAFLGTLVADQGLYYVGRLYGHRILERFPKLKAPSEKAFRLLKRWDIWYILSFRFIYGIRIISPVVIGAGGISPQRFIPLNFISALVWTSVSCTGGYLLGKVIDAIDFSLVEHYIFLVSAGLLALVIGIGYFGWKKLHSTDAAADKD
ncbi:DedA family protein [Candidatus Odyssella acanthamoebae]|uniref:DedA family protein n=1 Tax=Candidatus Odyssella acanthamoebae TaxID=91604 RepID=UPI000690079B|nr:DedA family protein [Candidatus Paracaedibacter acanthamoebae]